MNVNPLIKLSLSFVFRLFVLQMYRFNDLE